MFLVINKLLQSKLKSEYMKIVSYKSSYTIFLPTVHISTVIEIKKLYRSFSIPKNSVFTYICFDEDIFKGALNNVYTVEKFNDDQ